MGKKLLFALMMLIGLLPVSGAFAGVNSGGLTVSTDYVAKKEAVHCTRGEITAVNGSLITVSGTGYYDEVTVLLRSRTYVVKAEDGSKLEKSELQVGDSVAAYYGEKASRSLPPQVQGVALIVGEAKLGHCFFFPVAKVKTEKDKASKGSYAVITNQSGDLIATVTEFACAAYDEIEVGDNVLLWCDLISLSLPARTNASKVVVLPDK